MVLVVVCLLVPSAGAYGNITVRLDSGSPDASCEIDFIVLGAACSVSHNWCHSISPVPVSIQFAGLQVVTSHTHSMCTAFAFCLWSFGHWVDSLQVLVQDWHWGIRGRPCK